MSKNKILGWLGWLLMALGLLIIIFRRVVGIDLTEGQLLVQDLPWWILATGCVLGGYAIVTKAQGK